MAEPWTPVKSDTGFKHCRQCGRYRPHVKNGRCSECRGVQTDAENGSDLAVDSSTGEKRITPDTPLQKAALDAIEKYDGLRPAARELSKMRGYEINHGVIGLAADGQDFPAARRALGFPPKTVEVEPCPDCGEVHTQYKTCDHERKAAHKNGKRHRLHYEAGRGEHGRKRRDKVQAWLARNGFENLTEAVDSMIGDG